MEFSLPFFHRPGDLVLGRSGPLPCFPSVRLRAQQRATHMYVIGITGQGKSKLLQHCLFQDIMSGRGCGVLDPHTDLVQDLLAQLAAAGFFRSAKNRERVIYFEPSRRDYVVPFNVLATAYPPYTTATNLIEAFRRTWPESLREAPRFTNIMLAALLTLIANHLTLAQLPRFLSDKSFRDVLLENAHDPEATLVFHERMDKWGRERALILESIFNKISAFTLNPTLKLILGQPQNHLDFRQMMDSGKILLVDLGRCDGETRKLLGSMIVTGLEQAALSRKDEPSRTRRPFYFYIDEFQDFCANESSVMTLAHILSESRKFGLHLTLAHQTLGQMTSERMRSALGNIGTKIVFAVDREDAEIMARKLFMVDGEQIKHEVENEYQQEKSHPVYYSLQEGWEQAIQTIQNLKPRTCLIKRPQRGVVRAHTIKVPHDTLSATDLDHLQRSLVSKDGNVLAKAMEQIEQGAPLRSVKATTYFEPVENTLSRGRTRLTITA